MAVTFTTIKGDKELDYGYGGFRYFRATLAAKIDKELGELYGDTVYMLRYPDAFNKQFNALVSQPRFAGKEELIEFLCMSDCDGKIPARLCKQIAEIMNDDDSLTEMMRWCAEHRRKLVWY
jgi:hypothetical protein